MLKPVNLLSGLIPLAGILGSSCTTQQPNPNPNIVVVLFDDLGWDDLGIHGNNLIETPNIDAFADQSAQFSNFYVNPVCAPSRASFLTGRHFLRTGVSHVHGGKDFLNTDETTIADVLSKNGYKTAMWGKWHSGDAEGYYPWQRGFEEALSLRLYKHREAEGYFNGEHITSTRWADELIVDHGIDFMKRNSDVPFFAFVSLLSPHTPLVAPDDVIQKYLDKGLSQNFATLYAMIDFSDQELGRLFHAMDELNLSHNTIVMILSDNGPAVNRAEISDEDRAIRYVNGYRGHKGDIWENGVKSPLFIRWPGMIQPKTITHLAGITDLFPTILDFAGINHESEKPMDGMSFRDKLFGESELDERHIYNYANKGWPPSLEPYNPDGNYNEYQPVDKASMIPEEQVISVRTPQYKLMLNPGIDGSFNVPDSIVLIDMINDPRETTNLAWDKPELTQKLKNILTDWYRGVLDEAGSYTTPLLYLHPEVPTTVRATWVSDLSENLLNTVTAVKRWQGSTGWVEYLLVAETEQDFEMVLEYKKPLNAVPVCKVLSGNREISVQLEGAESTKTEPLRLSKGENIIRVYIQPDGQGRNIDELSFIRISPV
jgi:arylsulfatase A-like enzyme